MQVVARQADASSRARRGSRRRRSCGEDPEPVRRQGDVELAADARRRGRASGCWRNRPSAATSAAARALAAWRGRRRRRNRARPPRPARDWRCRPAGRARAHPRAGCRGAPCCPGARPSCGGQAKVDAADPDAVSGAISVPARKFMEPTKSATKARRGPAVDLLRRADLLDHAVVHHHDAVGHGQRLLLVVRHHDGGDAERPLQRLDLVAQPQPHAGIERRQRLVEQQQAGRGRERARQRHALLLAAGELGRIFRRRHRAGRPAPAARSTRFAIAAAALAAADQPVADIVGDRQVGKQRVGLEDDAEVALRPAAAPRRPAPSGGSCRRSADRGRRWRAAGWSCRSPRGRGSRRTRPRRRRARRRRGP